MLKSTGERCLLAQRKVGVDDTAGLFRTGAHDRLFQTTNLLRDAVAYLPIA